jgi:hypothetical protein
MSWLRTRWRRSAHEGKTQMKTGESSTRRSGRGTCSSHGNRLRTSEVGETRFWPSSWQKRGCQCRWCQSQSQSQCRSREKLGELPRGLKPESCVRGRELHERSGESRGAWIVVEFPFFYLSCGLVVSLFHCFVDVSDFVVSFQNA